MPALLAAGGSGLRLLGRSQSCIFGECFTLGNRPGILKERPPPSPAKVSFSCFRKEVPRKERQQGSKSLSKSQSYAFNEVGVPQRNASRAGQTSPRGRLWQVPPGRGLAQGGPSAEPRQLDNHEARQVHPRLSSEAAWDDTGNQYLEPTLQMMLMQATLGPRLEN